MSDEQRLQVGFDKWAAENGYSLVPDGSGDGAYLYGDTRGAREAWDARTVKVEQLKSFLHEIANELSAVDGRHGVHEIMQGVQAAYDKALGALEAADAD